MKSDMAFKREKERKEIFLNKAEASKIHNQPKLQDVVIVYWLR